MSLNESFVSFRHLIRSQMLCLVALDQFPSEAFVNLQAGVADIYCKTAKSRKTIKIRILTLLFGCYFHFFHFEAICASKVCYSSSAAAPYKVREL